MGKCLAFRPLSCNSYYINSLGRSRGATFPEGQRAGQELIRNWRISSIGVTW